VERPAGGDAVVNEVILEEDTRSENGRYSAPSGGEQIPTPVPPDGPQTPQVVLTSFSASWVGSQVKVNWSTTTEINNDQFKLYQSTSTLGPWIMVNQVMSTHSCGAFTSTSPEEYTYLDTGVSTGLSYYYKLLFSGERCGIGALAYAQIAVAEYPLESTISSITRANVNPTNASSVDFSVTFSEEVLGLDAGDFVLTKTGTINGESVIGVSGGPVIYTVSVSTGTGSGDLRLDVPAGATVTNSSGNPLAGLPFTSGENYTVIKNLGVAGGIVQRQGMPASPDLSLNSTICSSVTAIGAETFGPLNTDNNGTFQFPSMPGGLYTFRADYPGYLVSEKTGVSISATTIDLGTTTLRGGDVNGDNAINIYDVVKIVNKFGQSGVAVRGATCSDPDEAADINNDGLVNIRDLTITTGNWGLVGPLPWQP
jgi:hypothetical protein